jgi:hypothetical protein
MPAEATDSSLVLSLPAVWREFEPARRSRAYDVVNAELKGF